MRTRFTSALLFFTGIAQLVLAQNVTTIMNNGPSTDRVDLVVLGDGYTMADLPKYITDVQQLVLNMFQQEPYSEYNSYFNVHRIDVISADSGVDHPETNTYKNTALDAAYNCGGIQRLICVDTTKVFNIVNSLVLPSQRDIVLVLVNDSTYGGSGGTVAVGSTNPLSVEIVLHELGHSFGLLTDEYGGPPPPNCDSSVEPAYPNATRGTVRATIKWNSWIDATTGIPTLSTAPGVPGLYEGAKYCDTGLYRPTYNSKMRSLGMPFEEVNSEQIVKRYYNWVSPIQSSSPAQTPITVTQGQRISFSIETMVPSTHTLDVTWRLDGQPNASGASYLLDSSSLSLVDHSVVAIAHDPTGMVQSDPNGILTENVSWAVRVLPSPCDVNKDGVVNIVDVQLMINQVLGLIPATSDINRDGLVNIVDVQFVVNATLGLGCPN